MASPPSHNSYHVESLVAKFSIGAFLSIVLVIIFCRKYCYNANSIIPTSTNTSSNSDIATSADIEFLSGRLPSLPVFVYASVSGDKLDCSVCLTEFGEGEEGRILPSCRHIFHMECVGLWLRSHSTCPLCRSSIELPV